MSPHVFLTIGEYAFRRVVTGWFIRLLGVTAAGIMILLFWGGPDPSVAMVENRSAAIFLIELAAVVIVIVMGATEIPRDIETRTIMILLSKPVTKDDVVIGKWLGLVYVAGFTVVVLTAVCLIGAVAAGMVDPNIKDGLTPDVNLLQRVLFGFFQAVIVAAIVILISTRLNEIAIIALTAFYSTIGLFSFYLRILLKRPDLPWFSRPIIYGLYYMFPNFKYLSMPIEDPMRGAVSWSHFFLGAGYAIAFSAVLLVLSLISFRGREVAG